MLTFVLPSSSLLLLLLCGSGVVSSNNVHTIHNAHDLIKFSNDILDGVSFLGSTVYLDSDIEFDDELSSQFVPIGRYVDDRFFNGTFDGQGHRIINLKEIAQDPEGSYAGLFGHSLGLTTIRNVVMDSSCTIKSNYSARFSGVYAAGIIGGCEANNGPCLVENCVNMANITYIGGLYDGESGTPYLFMGGIAAELHGNNFEITIRNCANYGTISRTGTYDMLTFIGGIAGDTDNYGSNVYIQNSLNYGTLYHDEPTGWFYIGGIAGRYFRAILENCVSAGTISTTSTDGKKGALISGDYQYSSEDIIHCLWTSDVGCENISGSGGSVVENSSLITMNSTTVNELNEYASSNNWTMWLLNTNNASVTFEVGNGAKDITFSSQLILLPDLAGTGNETRFSGWHKDPNLFDPLSEYEVNGDTKFYSTYGAIWEIIFDGNGGNSSAASKVVKANEKYGDLPSANRTGYTFAGWFTEAEGGEEITSETIVALSNGQTLYAKWNINNYLLTFEVDGGISTGITLKFNETIDYMNVPEREGYVFKGWSPSPERMPAYNLTVTAQWDKLSVFVKITFSTKDLSEKEANTVLADYSTSEYTIERFEVVGEETIIIIKFVDEINAKNFVEKVEAASNMGIISMIGYTDEIKSFSSPIDLPFFLPLLGIF